MGDAESDSEQEILERFGNVTADVLKCGHHGSSTSTSQAFLDRVSPEYAVISCGRDNSYGHPHQETLERCERKRNGLPHRSAAYGDRLLRWRKADA